MNPKLYFHRPGLSKRFGFSGPPFWNGLPAPCPQKKIVSQSCSWLIAFKRISFPSGFFFLHNFILLVYGLLWLFSNDLFKVFWESCNDYGQKLRCDFPVSK